MKKSVIVILHLTYWALYCMLLLLIYSIGMTSNKNALPITDFYVLRATLILTVLPALGGFYSFYAFLFDRFLHRRKILALFASGILASLASGLLSAFIGSVLIQPDIFFRNGLGIGLEIVLFMSFMAVLNGGMGLILKGFITWYNELRLKEELNRKNHEMEMALIKAQLNPHFLFNTINNIDVLIEKDAARASLYLNKLSDIMRFMLYETQAEKIPLAQELSYIDKYLDLQRIRSANPDYLKYEREGNPDDLRIAPMLFMPFLENAFKHAENKRQDNAIRIQIQIERDTVIFVCENSFTESPAVKPESGGIGNELIRRRLALLYPTRHSLDVSRKDQVYRVKLVLRLHEN